MPVTRCNRCLFWDDADLRPSDRQQARCLRRPPVMAPPVVCGDALLPQSTTWPITADTDGCGDGETYTDTVEDVSEVACHRCRFWWPGPGETPDWGECRRRAPLAQPSDEPRYNVIAAFPRTKPDASCGEWQETYL